MNGKKFLKQQLESIINQTHQIDEIVVVDDLSTDGTRLLLLQFIKDNSCFNIKFIQNKENLGVNKAFELALKASTGDYNFISDQDEVWREDKVRLMLDQNDDSSLTCSDATIVNSSLSTLFESELKATNYKLYLYDLQFLFSNCLSGHNMMLRKEFLPQVLPFPEDMIFDKWLALVAKNSCSLLIVTDNLCLHRMHNDNYINNFS